MYEHVHERPVSTRRFAWRMAHHAWYAALVVLPSLVLGTLIFRVAVRQSWHLAFLNAAMLLAGMGPVGNDLGKTVGGSVAAAIFALYAGLVFLAVAGLLLAPVFHRVLHRFHWEAEHGGAA